MDFTDFVTGFMNAVHARADQDNTFTAEAFTAEAADQLTNLGEAENLMTLTHFEGITRKGARMALDAVDLDNPDESVALAVTVFDPDPDKAMTTAAAKTALQSIKVLLRDAIDGTFFEDQEQSTEAYAIARELHNRGKNISRYRLFILTNLPTGRRSIDLEDDLINLIPVEHHVWDLSRFFQVHEASLSHLPLDIDLTTYAPQGIPALEIEAQAGSLRTFLAAVPGRALADLYSRHGSRLLEGNVRSFLSTRGKVNKGIKATLSEQPERFLAYNNGITATASRVQRSDAGALVSVTDLQIVNGGQTTASLYFSSRDKNVRLDDTFVQMKLIEVSSDQALEMVPLISRFANSQNKVSDADFFSNSPFHRRMEELSRRILTPSRSGVRLQTRWFYERNRGQYQNELAKLGAAERKREEAVTPRSQVITKTDAASYLMAWNQRPHTVSAGAQKNFMAFATTVQDQWDRREADFNELYFKELVGKAMLYRELRRAISRADWYDKGYLANLTAYAISKLAHDVSERRGAAFPFDRLWSDQSVPQEILQAGLQIGEAVLSVLTSQTRPAANVTEWAKREACWEEVRKLKIDCTPEFWDLIATKEERASALKAAAETQRIDGQVEVLSRIVAAAPTQWAALEAFALRRKLLTATESSLVKKMTKGGMIPSDRQIDALVKLIRRASENGYNDDILS